jgi:hypothetical protein
VTSPFAPPTRQLGTLLLADISGYTSFLQGVDDAHREFAEMDEPPMAYVMMSSLLDAISSAIAPAFSVAKLEGDAVFAIAEDGAIEGAGLLELVDRCYARFQEDLSRAGQEWICNCSACSRASELDLKFIVHHGRWIAQTIGGNRELLGPDVNLVHRLLKNGAQKLIGPVPYVLLTQQVIDALAIPSDGMPMATEDIEGMGSVQVHVKRI